MYAQLRHNIRSNNIQGVNDFWGLAWPLFHSTNKWLYARLSLYVQHIVIHAHPTIRFALDKRMISLRGELNRHISTDLMTEKMNRGGR